MSSSHLAQLMVFWLEQKHVHASHRELLYQGMAEEFQARGKTIQTDRDVEEMQCRWLRLAIHAELDALREECAVRDEEMPVELEVEGGLVEGEAQSLGLEAEREAAAMVEDMDAQQPDDPWDSQQWGEGEHAEEPAGQQQDEEVQCDDSALGQRVLARLEQLEFSHDDDVELAE